MCSPEVMQFSEDIYRNSPGTFELWQNMVVILLRPQEATYYLLLTVAKNGCSSGKENLHFTISIYMDSA